MAIKATITDTSHFYQWMKQSDSYQNQFTYDGANALQEYLEDLSDDIDEDIEFDPIAWCVEWSEYKDFDTFQSDTGYTQNGQKHVGYPEIESLDDLKDNTTVIEFDGGIIVQDF